MDQVKKFVRGVKEVAMDYDDVQLRVREATSNDPVGADERLLARIAHDTRDRYSYNSMFSILWKRITDLHQPSHILKGLILTDYLLVHGDDRFVRDMRTKKNVVKRLTGYKFYREHEDVGGEVRGQAKKVLELLNNEDTLEKMRKERTRGDKTLQVDRYDRNYRSGAANNEDQNSELDSPSNHVASKTAPETPASQASYDQSYAEGNQRHSRKSSKSERVKDKKKKEKKDKKKKEKKVAEKASFDSSLSDEEDVMASQAPQAMANTTTREVDLLTGQGSAPVDWFSAMNLGSDAQQKHPSLSIESGGKIFHGTPIDPTTPRGTPETDGFAFDDALEIGSDDDNDKGFWNVGSNLIDVSDLRAHAPPKKPQVVTGSAPSKTLAEIAASNRPVTSDLAIFPVPSQQPTNQFYQQPFPQQHQQLGQTNPYGYAQVDQQFQSYGYTQQQPVMGGGNPFQHMPMQGAYPPAPMQPQMYNQMPPYGQAYPQNPFSQPQQQTPQRLPNDPFQKPAVPADPFAALWKP